MLDILEKAQGMPYLIRGSAAGSLVCYLLGISHIDPVREDMCLARCALKNRKLSKYVEYCVGNVRIREIRFRVSECGIWGLGPWCIRLGIEDSAFGVGRPLSSRWSKTLPLREVHQRLTRNGLSALKKPTFDPSPDWYNNRPSEPTAQRD